MALHEDARLIKPQDLVAQVDWKKLEGVIIIGLMPKGEENVLHMSSLSVEEISFLSKQLDAHVNCILGPMKEM